MDHFNTPVSEPKTTNGVMFLGRASAHNKQATSRPSANPSATSPPIVALISSYTSHFRTVRLTTKTRQECWWAHAEHRRFSTKNKDFIMQLFVERFLNRFIILIAIFMD